MERVFEDKVLDCLGDRREYLVPIFHDTYEIALKLREIIPTLFVCINLFRNHRIEVHDMSQPFTFATSPPYRTLDARTLQWVRQHSQVHRGRRVMDEVLFEGEAAKALRKRRRRSDLESIAREMRPLISRMPTGV